MNEHTPGPCGVCGRATCLVPESGGGGSLEYVLRKLDCLDHGYGRMADALAALLAKADALIFRPSVDDSRKIDQDTRALREALEPARSLLRTVGRLP